MDDDGNSKLRGRSSNFVSVVPSSAPKESHLDGTNSGVRCLLPCGFHSQLVTGVQDLQSEEPRGKSTNPAVSAACHKSHRDTRISSSTGPKGWSLDGRLRNGRACDSDVITHARTKLTVIVGHRATLGHETVLTTPFRPSKQLRLHHTWYQYSHQIPSHRAALHQPTLPWVLSPQPSRRRRHGLVWWGSPPHRSRVVGRHLFCLDIHHQQSTFST